MRLIDGTTIPNPDPCPDCGTPAQVQRNMSHFTHVTCPECYDGAPDAGPQRHSWSRCTREAIMDWNEQCDPDGAV